MLTFLFWNLKKTPPERTLSRLVAKHDIDIIMLTECPLAPATVLMELNDEVSDAFHHSDSTGSGIHIYSKFTRDRIASVEEEHGVTVRHLKPPVGSDSDIILAVAHLQSKLYQSSESQSLECTEIARSIRDVEKRVGHRRTVLVGDLNMNPFEPGVAGAAGLNAVMARAIAKRGSRSLHGREYPFFYNPMWNRFGDSTPGSPGTYYRDGSEHHTYFWYMFDQVLVRPDLLDRFDNDNLHILDTDGHNSLLTDTGRPHKGLASDHLPLLFQLDL